MRSSPDIQLSCGGCETIEDQCFSLLMYSVHSTHIHHCRVSYSLYILIVATLLPASPKKKNLLALFITSITHHIRSTLLAGDLSLATHRRRDHFRKTFVNTLYFVQGCQQSPSCLSVTCCFAFFTIILHYEWVEKRAECEVVNEFSIIVAARLGRSVTKRAST